MDPLLPILTAHSPPWNEADSPRTHDLEHLRAKRVAYYESIGIIKGDASRNSSQPVWTASQDTRVNPSENQAFGLRGLQMSLGCLAIEKKPLLQEVSKVVPGEAEQDQDQRVQEGPRRERPPTELDLKLLADALVPETEKLRHVINWAQKFLPKPPKEDGLKGPTASLGFPRSNPYQSSEAPRNKKNAHLKSPDCPLLLRADQSSAQTNIQIFSLSPPNNWSEMDLSSEFLSSFLREDFPGSESCECQETTVRNEGDGRAAECPPNSLQWEDSAQEKYSRSGNSIHIPSEDEAFPERLGPQPPLSCTSEESKILEGTRQSSPRKSYF
ncbi:uncharacterized protein LOC128778677 [Panthera pardus]|uniref:Uncharacterized protein LOC128778677 n=1 Tax=Panthera pardus TaxID=9691 RepID=A0A9W2W1V2_PANPR|nr:uncharacterized protein LOC128778677 [Panthera pardus]